MPKKNYKAQTAKLPPAFASSSQPTPSSHGPPERSVNDLIQHLRRTQTSGSQTRNNDRDVKIAPRSVHPSLRNLLELPETPPPRPRHGHRVQQIGGRRVRRTPGPAAPASWLSPDSQAQASSEDRYIPGNEGHGSRVHLQLDRLPGLVFPARNTLQYTVMKSMALQWDWHLVYDGEFLSELPTHLKLLLLSFIAVYTEHEFMAVQMQGLEPLFMRENVDGGVAEDNSDVIRLDLGRAIGHWIGLKELNRELKSDVQRPKAEFLPPSSWEEEAEASYQSPTVFSPNQSLSLRFERLRYLSLAHPAPGAANWSSLLSLLSNFATLTHLSLAHWPLPTLKPNSLKARFTHPKIKSLSFAYGGSDIYSSYENNWSEAATVLAKLSRTTYCLKWLDLEGCSEWIPALSWDGVDLYGGVHPTSGPEWNGSWRGIEWLGIAPGWSPEPVGEASDTMEGTKDGEDISGDSDRAGRMEEHRRLKQREAYAKCIETAKEVQGRLRSIRREGRGKWLDVSVEPEASQTRYV